MFQRIRDFIKRLFSRKDEYVKTALEVSEAAAAVAAAKKNPNPATISNAARESKEAVEAVSKSLHSGPASKVQD